MTDTAEPLMTVAAPTPGFDKSRPQRLWLHAVLFVVTFFSAVLSHVPPLPGEGILDHISRVLLTWEAMRQGLPFAVPLMAILLAHEMGHYITARRYGVDQSLPYFIPAPTLFGTLGAVIMMRSQPENRRALLHVAVNGPYAGLVLAIPAAAWGLAHSTPVDPDSLSGSYYWFGSSILFHILEQLFSPNGTDVSLHPVAFAGWVGMFVTSLNLIPAGQLDGGHVAYAIFGRWHRFISRLVVMALIVLGLMMGSRGGVWLLWGFMLLFILGTKHPKVADEELSLSRRDRLNGAVALLFFIITFVPVPMELVQGRGVEPRSPYDQLFQEPDQEQGQDDDDYDQGAPDEPEDMDNKPGPALRDTI